MNFDIIEREIRFSAVRSRGPGGQNVNKVSSAAVLYWAYQESEAVTAEQKLLIASRLSTFINKENFLYLRSDAFRDLEKNKAACLNKLRDLLARAFHRPKKRRPTRPTTGSKTRRRESKIKRGQLKESRRKVWS